jgi:glycerol kinase
MTKFIGAIDQGTTSTRFMIFDDEGVEVARAQKEHRQILPRPGWVEHDADEIIENTREVIAAACARARVSLAGIESPTQRETALAWDRRRAARSTMRSCGRTRERDSFLRELKSKGLEDLVSGEDRASTRNLFFRREDALAARQCGFERHLSWDYRFMADLEFDRRQLRHGRE